MGLEVSLVKHLRTVGVVGAGAMGRGIAQVCAAAGCSVRLLDANEGAATNAIEAVRSDLMQLVGKGRLPQADADATLERLGVAKRLDDLSECELVVDAIVEKLDVKQELMRELEAIVETGCILATNTDFRRSIGRHADG